MSELRTTVAAICLLFSTLGVGCSYVVDFDRSLLVDAGVDGGDPDSGFGSDAEAARSEDRTPDDEVSADEP
ncbi:MAG: hypothetical protein ACN4G0_18140 [Polyangiales bacterium]